MPESNPDKSYGWYTAKDFNDYMESVIGEINIKFFSIILIISIITLR